MFNPHQPFQGQQPQQQTAGFMNVQPFPLPSGVPSSSLWTTPLSGQAASSFPAGYQQSLLGPGLSSTSAVVGEKRRFEQIAGGENKENLTPAEKRPQQQSTLRSAKTESPEENDDDEEESDNSNNSSGSTNNTTSAGDEDVSSESESLLTGQQGQLVHMGQQLNQSLLPYPAYGGSGLGGGLYPAQHPLAHSTPHLGQQQSTSTAAGAAAGMNAFTAAANYWYSPSAAQAAQGAVLAQHLQSTAHHMAASYLASGGFATQQQHHQPYSGGQQQGYSFSSNRGGGAMDGSYLEGQLPGYHSAATSGAAYNPFAGSWPQQQQANATTPSAGGNNDDSGIVNTSNGGEADEAKELGERKQQETPRQQQLALVPTASQAGALNPFLNRYTGVPGRLALLSHNRKYSVTFGEVCRRISPPECLNASYLGGILRKAKNKNGGKALREELKRCNIHLPSGRRKSAPVSVFTSLCEQEAEQMAIDFRRLNEAEFPREELADALLQSVFAGHSGGPQQKLALMAGANQLVQEAISIVAVVEKAAGGVPMAPANLSAEEQRKLAVVEQATKEGLVRFSRLTHGFGNLAMLTAWRCFQEVLSHCTVKLRSESGGGGSGGGLPGTSRMGADGTGQPHQQQPQGLMTPANSSSSSSGSSNTSCGVVRIGHAPASGATHGNHTFG